MSVIPFVHGTAYAASDAPVAPLRNRNQKSKDEFIPLLVPKVRVSKALARSANIFHGTIRNREMYAHVQNGKDDLVSRMESNGSLERIAGKRLSLTWNGQLSNRQGNAYTTATDYHTTRLRMFDASLTEIFNDGSARQGRFLPDALPGLGFLDGAQVQMHATDALQLGADVGVRPNRQDLALSGKEPLASVYAVYDQGERGDYFYEGVLGFMQTLFKGVSDETAVLYDQRTDLGPKLNLFLTSQVNFNSGAAEVNTDTARLTRGNIYLTYSMTPTLGWRTGADHYELPDTAAQRDLLSGTTQPFAFQSNYSRYWLGGTQHLPFQLQLDEEISLISTYGQPDLGQGRGTISRYECFVPDDRLSLTMYTMNHIGGGGVGGYVSEFLPLLYQRLNITASLGARYASDFAGDSRKFRANDASIYVNWLVSHQWTLNLGCTQTYQQHTKSTFGDFSLVYHW